MEKSIAEINVAGTGQVEANEVKQIRTGPVTFEEVREVVEDPFSTNASRIREALGRGSFGTIQKHLQSLRDEIQKEREVKAGDAPEAPDIVLQSLWMHAWHAAEAQVRTRMEQIVTERDGYRATAEAATGDVATLTEALDAAEAQAEEQTQASTERLQQAVAEHAQALETIKAEAQAEVDAKAKELEKAKAEVDAKAERIRELEHAAETSALKWGAERQTILSLNEGLNAKLRDADTEREKILERIEKIQVDADSRVNRIEAAAAERVAEIEAKAKTDFAEAQARIAEVEAKAKDEIASLRAEKEAAEKAVEQARGKKK